VEAQAQEGDGQEVSDLLIRVAGRVRDVAEFVMQHGGTVGL